MEIVIIVVCSLFAAGLFAALVAKAVSMVKQMRRYREELAQISDSENYLLDIVQDGKTVRIECKDVNSDNVEVVAKDKELDEGKEE